MATIIACKTRGNVTTAGLELWLHMLRTDKCGGARACCPGYMREGGGDKDWTHHQ